MLIIPALLSCGSGWSDEDKADFQQRCVDFAVLKDGMLNPAEYCKCAQKKCEDLFPSYKNDMGNERDFAVVVELNAKDCETSIYDY